MNFGVYRFKIRINSFWNEIKLSKTSLGISDLDANIIVFIIESEKNDFSKKRFVIRSFAMILAILFIKSLFTFLYCWFFERLFAIAIFNLF